MKNSSVNVSQGSQGSHVNSAKNKNVSGTKAKAKQHLKLKPQNLLAQHGSSTALGEKAQIKSIGLGKPIVEKIKSSVNTHAEFKPLVSDGYPDFNAKSLLQN